MTSPDGAGLPSTETVGDWNDGTIDFAGLVGAFASKWTQINSAEAQANEALLQAYDLATRTLALEGVIGYSSARMSSAFTPGTSYSKVPFDTRLGPEVGATHSSADSQMVLGSKGLWEFSYKVTWDLLVGPVNHGIYASLVVRTSGGAEFYRASMVEESNDPETTRTETGRFVVPAAGYIVSVEARAGVGYRGLRGDAGYNQLNIVKISSETS